MMVLSYPLAVNFTSLLDTMIEQQEQQEQQENALQAMATAKRPRAAHLQPSGSDSGAPGMSSPPDPNAA
jgi:hypothetical protein